MYDLVVDRYIDPQYYALLLAHIHSKAIITSPKVILLRNYAYSRSHAVIGSVRRLNFDNYIATCRWRQATLAHYRDVYDFSELAARSFQQKSEEVESLASSIFSGIVNFEPSIICRGIEVGDLVLDGFQRTNQLINRFHLTRHTARRLNAYCTYIAESFLYFERLLRDSRVGTVISHHSCYAHFGLLNRMSAYYGIRNVVIKNENLIFDLKSPGDVHSLDPYLKRKINLPSPSFLSTEYNYTARSSIYEKLGSSSYSSYLFNLISNSTGGSREYVYIMHNLADNNFPFSSCWDNSPYTYIESLHILSRYWIAKKIKVILRVHPSFSNPLYSRFRTRFLDELRFLSCFSNIKLDIPSISPYEYQAGTNYQIIANQSSTVAELASLGVRVFAHGRPPVCANAYHSFDIFSHPYLDQDISSLDEIDTLEARRYLAIADFHRSRLDDLLPFIKQIIQTSKPTHIVHSLTNHIKNLNHCSFISSY